MIVWELVTCVSTSPVPVTECQIGCDIVLWGFVGEGIEQLTTSGCVISDCIIDSAEMY